MFGKTFFGLSVARFKCLLGGEDRFIQTCTVVVGFSRDDQEVRSRRASFPSSTHISQEERQAESDHQTEKVKLFSPSSASPARNLFPIQ